MKKILLIICFAMGSTFAFGQQEVMINQYMFNGLFLNPAYAGSHEHWSASLFHRNQWVGFKGSPKTFLISAEGPFNEGKHGLGGILSYDQIGVTTQADFYLNYAYRIKFDHSSLSFGLRGGVSWWSSKDNELVAFDQNDDLISNGLRNIFLPKVGFGAYYYARKWYAGFSVPTLLAWQQGEKFSVALNKSTFLDYHYYLTAGYIFQLDPKWKLKPSFLLKYVKNAPLQADINLSANYNNFLWFGVSYRTMDAVIGMMQFTINKRFRIGYSYEYPFSRLRTTNSGSHEIMLGVDFGRELVSIKTPRFF